MTHGDLKQLRDILKIRDVQRQAAEHVAREREADFRAARMRRDQASSALRDLEAAWHMSIGKEGFDVTLLPAWNDALLAGQAELSAQDTDLTQADQMRHAALERWRCAVGHEDVAAAIWMRARQAEQRDADEKAVLAMEDQRAGRSVAA